VRLRARQGGGRDEPFEKSWLSWPGREEQFTGNGACGVAQEQHDGDDVVLLLRYAARAVPRELLFTAWPAEPRLLERLVPATTVARS